MVLYFMNYTMVYYNKDVGVLGNQCLTPLSLLPEFQSRTEREDKVSKMEIKYYFCY